MEQWSLIQDQPLLKTIFKNPPIISFKKTYLLEQNYNLKVLMRRDHNMHIGSPCRPVIYFISISLGFEPTFQSYSIKTPLTLITLEL